MSCLVIEHQMYYGFDFSSVNGQKKLKENYIVTLKDNTKSRGENSLAIFDTKEEAISFCSYYMEHKEADVVYQL